MARLRRNEYVKSHGLGNDYLVMDPRALAVRLTPRAIRLICHRNLGVGSDGILTLERSRRAEFGLRILNPDGSEAEKSGNGIRIFAKFLWDHGYTRRREFRVDTKGGVVPVTLDVRGAQVRSITAGIGRATFRSREIPATGPDREIVGERIEAAGETLDVTAVSVGNPHCIVFVADPAAGRPRAARAGARAPPDVSRTGRTCSSCAWTRRAASRSGSGSGARGRRWRPAAARARSPRRASGTDSRDAA